MEPQALDKPKPLGVVPRKQWLETRFKELAVSVIQHLEIDVAVPGSTYREIEKVANELRTKQHLLAAGDSD